LKHAEHLKSFGNKDFFNYANEDILKEKQILLDDGKNSEKKKKKL
jgi:hypothetical protein